MPKLQYLQDFLDNNIPLARSMGIRPVSYSDTRLVLSAPLAANTNHHATAFGGSIATLGIVAGWALVHLRLLDAQLAAKLVIQKTSCEFIAPTTADFEAHCQVDARWDVFQRELNQNGKARLELTTDILCAGQITAKLESSYAALLKK